MTPVPKIPADQFLELFAPIVRPILRKALERYPDCHGLVCFENLTMDSSEFGERSALVFGPSNTLNSVDAQIPPIGDVPSRFKYAVSWCDRPALLDALHSWHVAGAK